jgi:hypothetical protein
VSADVAAVKAVLPSALVSGRIDASVGAMATGVLTATAIAADAITDAKVASDVTIASVTGSVGSVTGLTASNLDVAVSTRLASASYTAPPSASTIAQAVWDALTSALTTVGSIGKLLVTNIDAAISSRSTYAGGDTSGTTTLLSRLTATRAGLLDHLDADISSRLASGSYTAPLDAAGTRSALGMASANLDTQIAALSTSAEITSLQSHGDSTWATATGFSTLDAGDVSAAVWDVPMADHLGAGTTGDAIFQAGVHAPSADSKADTILADIAALNNLSAADVKTQADQALADAGVTTARMSHLDADVSSRASQPSVDGLAIPTAADNADAVLAATYEGSETVQDHFRLARAALYGKANGLGGSTVHFRDAADSKNRLTASVDSDGNRAAVTTDAS